MTANANSTRHTLDGHRVVFSRLFVPEQIEPGHGTPRYAVALSIPEKDVEGLPETIRMFCKRSDFVAEGHMILNASTTFPPVLYGVSDKWEHAIQKHRLPIDHLISKMRPQASVVLSPSFRSKGNRTFLNLIAVELHLPQHAPTFQDFVDGKY